jgi:hypothetical protein
VPRRATKGGGAGHKSLHLAFHSREPPIHLGHLVRQPFDLARLRGYALLKQKNRLQRGQGVR